MTAERRIIVGLSGGVDSALTALLLQRAGFTVIGVTLRLQPCTPAADGDPQRRSCCGPGATEQAAAVAQQLGFRHFTVDCHSEFTDRVLRPCWDAFDRGQTPNPCILCNERVKFARLLDLARDLDAEAIATGHYARIEPGPDGQPQLLRGADPQKDQSYFLFALTPEQLAHTRFPLGDKRKTEVRELAREFGLCNAQRVDSQDVCFAAPQGGFAEFLRLKFAGTARPGEIVNEQGRVLGTHTGVHQFTLGQRHGLGVAAGTPVWVRAVDPATGRIELCDDGKRLLAAACTAGAMRWLCAPAERPQECMVQTRYHQTPVAGDVEPLTPDWSRIRVRFRTPVRAVTPGQNLVLYAGDRVLGGGWIEAAERPTS